eukprot:5693535-Ditylum_brightwellii.AAC.1
MVGGKELKPDVINEKDEGIQNSSIGCDLLLPDYVVISYKQYFQMVSKEEKTNSVAETLPSLPKLFCNNKGKSKRQSKHSSNLALKYNHSETILYAQDCPVLQTKVDKTHAIGSGIITVPYLTTSNASKFAYLSVEDIKTPKR